MGLDPWLLQALDYAGVVVFAASGALAASRKELDLVGFVFLAAITGVGGGTLRDVVLGHTPVFWIATPQPVILCTITALAVFFVAPHIEHRYRWLLWADAIGISGYCVMGASRGLDAGASPFAAIILGVMSATFGGIIRDIVAGEPSVVMRREIYVTATLAGATLFVVASRFGVPYWPAAVLGSAAAFLVRAGALTFGWTMPSYRSRPGRDIPSD